MKTQSTTSILIALAACISVHAASNWELGDQQLPPIETIAAAPPKPLPVYGLYCWSDEYLKHRDFIRDMGWKHLRISGPIDDEAVRALSEDQLAVMFTIAARRPVDRGPDKPARQWRNRADYDSDEAFIEDYLGDVTAVLDRYGPDGSFWKENPDLTFRPMQAIEVYNEPNFWYLDQTKDEWKADMQNPDEERRKVQESKREAVYAKLLPATAKLIKGRWPDVTVVGFGSGGSGYADVRFIKGVHEANEEVGASYDVLSTHPYTHHVPPETVAVREWGKYSQSQSTSEIREIMATHGAGAKPIWWTELGWGVHPDAGGRFDQANAVGGDKTVAPETQAAFYVRGYARALRLGIDRLTFMSIQDTDSFNSGLLHNDGSDRPSAKAVRTMLKVLPHPKLIATPVDGDNGLHVYRLKSDASAPGSPEVLMAWRVQGEEPLTLEWPLAKAEVVAMTGETSIVEAVDGKITLPLGPAPVYVRDIQLASR